MSSSPPVSVSVVGLFRLFVYFSRGAVEVMAQGVNSRQSRSRSSENEKGDGDSKDRPRMISDDQSGSGRCSRLRDPIDPKTNLGPIGKIGSMSISTSSSVDPNPFSENVVLELHRDDDWLLWHPTREPGS